MFYLLVFRIAHHVYTCMPQVAERKQHPCPSDTRRWSHQFLVIYRCLHRGGGGWWSKSPLPCRFFGSPSAPCPAGTPTIVHGASGRLTLVQQSVAQEHQEPIHSEAHNRGTYCRGCPYSREGRSHAPPTHPEQTVIMGRGGEPHATVNKRCVCVGGGGLGRLVPVALPLSKLLCLVLAVGDGPLCAEQPVAVPRGLLSLPPVLRASKRVRSPTPASDAGAD